MTKNKHRTSIQKMIHPVTCSWASISMGKTRTDVLCDLLRYVSGVTNLFPLQPSITVPLSSHYPITSSFMLIRSLISQIKVFIHELADIITTLDKWSLWPGHCSTDVKVLSGIQKGIVLGALCFLLDVHNMGSNISSHLKLSPAETLSLSLLYAVIHNKADGPIVQNELSFL